MGGLVDGFYVTRGEMVDWFDRDGLQCCCLAVKAGLLQVVVRSLGFNGSSLVVSMVEMESWKVFARGLIALL